MMHTPDREKKERQGSRMSVAAWLNKRKTERKRGEKRRGEEEKSNINFVFRERYTSIP